MLYGRGTAFLEGNISISPPISMPVWQSVLVAHGCLLDTGSQTLPLQLQPVGQCLHCAPTSSGSILPFNIPVGEGQTVTITWDSHLSRYIISISISPPISMPVWQSVLVAHGCLLDTGNQTWPLQLEAIGECLHCTPRSSGSIMPFNIPVRVGQSVTIRWDSDLSRYIISLSGKIAA